MFGYFEGDTIREDHRPHLLGPFTLLNRRPNLNKKPWSSSCQVLPSLKVIKPVAPSDARKTSPSCNEKQGEDDAVPHKRGNEADNTVLHQPFRGMLLQLSTN